MRRTWRVPLPVAEFLEHAAPLHEGLLVPRMVRAFRSQRFGSRGLICAASVMRCGAESLKLELKPMRGVMASWGE